MSTCSGCWRDQSVPGGVGVLATSGGEFFVVHDRPTELCPTQEPHHADACGEFLPVRPGFEPDKDGLRRSTLWMPYNWEPVFDALDCGKSMFAILEERCAR